MKILLYISLNSRIKYLDTSTNTTYSIWRKEDETYMHLSKNNILYTLLNAYFFGVGSYLCEIDVSKVSINTKINLSDYYTDLYLIRLDDNPKHSIDIKITDDIKVHYLPLIKPDIIGNIYIDITELSDENAYTFYTKLVDTNKYTILDKQFVSFSCIKDKQDRIDRIKRDYYKKRYFRRIYSLNNADFSETQS